MPISKPAAHTFSCALRILWAHRIYLLIYLVVMSQMGVFEASQSIPPSTDGSMPEAPAAVAVIDRDGSAVSRGLAAYLGREAELVEVADTQRALQDAVAQESVDCLLVVPAGYGDALVEAARTGVEAPALESSLSTSGAAGLLAQIQAQGWLQAVYGFVDTLGATPEEAVELADQTTEAGAEASVAPVSEGTRTLQQRLALRVYLAFSEYPIFAAATVCIAVLMRALNQRDVRERILVAPTHAFAHSLQVFGACMLVSLVCWLWIGGLGLVLFGGELPRTAGNGTAFFWGVDGRGRRHPLRLSPDNGAFEFPGFHLPLVPEAVIGALRDRNIYPGLFVSYMTLALEHGLCCHGGIFLVRYLPTMLHAVRDLFMECGEPLPPLPGRTMLAAFAISMQARETGRLFPAGMLELLTSGGISRESGFFRRRRRSRIVTA